VMRKLFLLAAFFACAAPRASAQTADDFNRVDIYGGFSHTRIETQTLDGGGNPTLERTGFNGFDASVTGNVSRYVGLKFDVSGHYKSESVSATFGTIVDCFPLSCEDLGIPVPPASVVGAGDIKLSLYNFLGGVQFKDNSKETKVKPFAHVLAGVAHARASGDGAFEFSTSESGFGAALGGGLDFRVSDRVDFRAVQFDYNPTRLGGETQHNFRVGVGVVFR
jgi:opacity protein-like surface antigen